jgi:dihydroorotase-like cyclic amidohydrolase
MLDAALRGRTSLERIVEAYALVPARHYGLRGKGLVAPGYAADLVLVDPNPTAVLADDDVHSKAGWTPYAGRELRGRVVATVLRGRLAQAGGQLVEPQPGGRHVLGPGARR